MNKKQISSRANKVQAMLMEGKPANLARNHKTEFWEVGGVMLTLAELMDILKTIEKGDADGAKRK